jgi:hypothetical protein
MTEAQRKALEQALAEVAAKRGVLTTATAASDAASRVADTARAEYQTAVTRYANLVAALGGLEARELVTR